MNHSRRDHLRTLLAGATATGRGNPGSRYPDSQRRSTNGSGKAIARRLYPLEKRHFSLNTGPPATAAIRWSRLDRVPINAAKLGYPSQRSTDKKANHVIACLPVHRYILRHSIEFVDARSGGTNARPCPRSLDGIFWRYPAPALVESTLAVWRISRPGFRLAVRWRRFMRDSKSRIAGTASGRSRSGTGKPRTKRQ